MNDIIARLTPGPVEPDRAWAEQTLRRIKASKAPKRRRRKFIAAGIAGGAILCGGVAVAQTVLAPQSVTRSFEELEAGANLKSTTGPVKIADIRLSNGTRWQVWRGLNDHGGSCWTSGDPSRGSIEKDFGQSSATCSYLPPEADQTSLLGDFARFDFYDQDDHNGLPIVYGQIVSPDVKAVRVVAPGYEKTVTPAVTTGGFGFELPFRLVHRKKNYVFDEMKIEYLTANGRVVRTDYP